MASRTACLLLAGCLLGLVSTSCSGGPRLGKVSGRVTVGGKPVTSGTIMFHPDAGPTAVAALQPDGAYTLTTIKPGDGAVVGSHRVTIQATNVGPGSLVDPKTFDEEIQLSRKGGKVLVPGKVTWVVPEKYSRAETSDLTAKVEPGPNTLNFDVPKP
jgi:hypothetical protein